MAALGLICVLASGSCWAQQSTSSTDAAAAHAKKSDAKKSSAKSAKTSSKPAAKAGKQVAAKDSKSTAKGGKKSSSDKRKDQADVADKSDVEPTPAVAAVAAKSEQKQVVDAKPEVAPPAGTMMGAYGQSLMRQPAAAAPVSPAPATASVAAATASSNTSALITAGTTAALAATAAATGTANLPVTAAASSLPPTAMMGSAGAGNASDSIAKYLQSRGLIAQPGAASNGSGLLNKVRDNASDLVLSAMNFLGVPYRRGGSSVSNGFDCSGFTRHIFEMSVGLVLPRRADEQAKMSSLMPIKKDDLKPGDLVFFNTMRQTFSHVGIYVGEGKFIHSPRAGGAVRVEDMREAYWAKRFTGARRADLNTGTPGT